MSAIVSHVMFMVNYLQQTQLRRMFVVGMCYRANKFYYKQKDQWRQQFST